MGFIEERSSFYLGREYDPRANKLDDTIVYYDSHDLTTHAVVVGMTGSGKTGLCLNMLEEAILDDLPAIVIDPKGDITNLLLTFPDFKPEDFLPWIPHDQVRRANMPAEAYAAQVAQQWRDGLEGWHIVPDRLKWMKLATQISIYTPGSDAGLPISILASLAAPRMDWNTQAEALRERINGLTTALYALVGMNVQPMKDEAHVLMANIIEWNWRQYRDLTIEDLILQIKQPPFDKLGVFALDQYINEKKRFAIAQELNNLLAAPSYQSWMQGDALDIQRLLYRPNGRPRVSVFYIAHLNDQERMFVMTLLLEMFISWMRQQPGTNSLRALLYIDEMYGFFPPYPKNPPSKDPLMRLLKQARAFGLGLILATQNPGDLDYKGLTNAGTWFIGRLQSANDKKRVIAGLREMASASDEMNLREVEQLIADLQPRVFLMRNVHNPAPLLMHTRWCMSYLAGPMTRQQIQWLMQGQRQQLMAQLQQQSHVAAHPQVQPLQQNVWAQAQNASVAPPMPPMPPGFGGGQMNTPPPMPSTLPGMSAPPMPPMPPAMPGAVPGFGAQAAATPPMPPMPTQSTPPPSPSATSEIRALQAARLPGGFSQSQPALTSSIDQYFLPTTITSQEAFGRAAAPTGQISLAYLPVLLAQSTVRYQHRASSIYTTRQYAFHVADLQSSGLIHWDEHQAPVVDTRQVARQPFGQAIFAEVPSGLMDARRLSGIQTELIDFLYSTARLIVPQHTQFKLFGDPDKDPSEFQAQVMHLAREKRDEEVQKLSVRYGDAMDKLEDRLRRKERELEAEKMELRDRRREQLYTTGEAIFSLMRGRTNYTLSRMSRTTRYKRQTEVDLKESRDVIGELERQMLTLEEEYQQKLQEVTDRWAAVATRIDELTLTPFKKDIGFDLYGVGWIPHYYALTASGQPIIAPAFG